MPRVSAYQERKLEELLDAFDSLPEKTKAEAHHRLYQERLNKYEERKLEEFLDDFASLSMKGKAEAQYRLNVRYPGPERFTGSSFGQLQKWEPYKDPNVVNKCCGFSEADIMVRGESVDQLEPISEGTSKWIGREYMDDRITSKEEHEHSIRKLAYRHDCVTGKWICFISQSEVTSLWPALCRDAVNGKLPPDVFAVNLGPVDPYAKGKWKREIKLNVRNVYESGMNDRIREYLEQFDLDIDAKLESDVATCVKTRHPNLRYSIPMDNICISKRTCNEESERE